MTRMLLLVMAVSLGGCELLTQQQAEQTRINAITPSPTLCEKQSSTEQFGMFCDLHFWSEYMMDNAEVKWPQRKQLIDSLSDTPTHLLQKILLSQATDTPYQYRLRAQNLITQLQQMSDQRMADALEIILYNPSQRMLEMESEITILKQLKAEQSQHIDQLEITQSELQETLELQKTQLKALLNIEANMVEQDNEQH